MYIPELHGAYKFLVFGQQQFPAQRFVALSGLPESRDIVRHRFHTSGIHNRFTYQALPAGCRLAASVFRQHRLGDSYGTGESTNRRISPSTWRGSGRVRFTRMSSGFERRLSPTITIMLYLREASREKNKMVICLFLSRNFCRY